MNGKSKYKVFINKNTKEITINYLDPNKKNYYTLVKEQRLKDNIQLIINFERYLILLENVSKFENVELVNMEFYEDDVSFSERVHQLIQKKDIKMLTQELSFFNQYNDIDIQFARLKGKINGHSFLITLQNNGIIISEQNNKIFDLLDNADKLRNLILQCLGLEDGKK